MSTPVTLVRGSTKQPGGEFLRHTGVDDLIGGQVGHVEEMRQVPGVLHPDRHGTATRVIGKNDQVTDGLEATVGQLPGPGLSVRDAESRHTHKCPPRGPVLPSADRGSAVSIPGMVARTGPDDLHTNRTELSARGA